MDYLSVDEARQAAGLRLVLTAGVPGPWSESAKALFRHHGVTFQPVRQEGGGANAELVAWTRHRNAPVALYNDEAPRVRWQEILDLAERLGNGPSLYPANRDDRIFMVGLVNEIAGERGFAWNARLLMLDATYQAVGDKAYRNPMLADYHYEPSGVAEAISALNGFLKWLANHAAATPGPYLVGNEFTAADLYWAYFSNLVSPQPHEVNPMPGFLRKTYELPATVLEPIDPALLEIRDTIFDRHLELPLDF